MSYCCIDLIICENLLRRVHEQDVYAVLAGEEVLLLSPALSYPAFAEVSLYGSLENLLGYRYKNPGMSASGVLSNKVAHTRYTSMFTLGKKCFYKRLAAESFFFFE